MIWSEKDDHRYFILCGSEECDLGEEQVPVIKMGEDEGVDWTVWAVWTKRGGWIFEMFWEKNWRHFFMAWMCRVREREESNHPPCNRTE